MSGAAIRRTRLRRDWTAVAAAFALALLAAAGLAAAVVDAAVAARWAVPMTGVAAFELWYLRRHLDANRAPAAGDAGYGGGTGGGGGTGTDAETRLYDTLGLPNALTLARGGAFAAVAGFAAVEPTPELAWLPAALYGAGCALDWADGAAAWAGGRTTVLGAKLDMAFDTVGFLVAPAVGVLWGRLPVWYLSLSLARYLFRAGRAWRRRRGRPVGEVPPSAVRRPLAALQMAFITVALAPALPAATVRQVAVVVLSPSLAVFARDYLVVAGHLDRQKANY